MGSPELRDFKHGLKGNPLKLYVKAYTVVGSLLRAEASVNSGADFRVYRPSATDSDGGLKIFVRGKGFRG